MSSLFGLIDAIPAYRWITIAKLVIAGGGALLLFWEHISGTEDAQIWRRTRAVVFAILGVLALGSWWNFGFNRQFIHVHEQYHYFMGAKYFRELGYTRLYECTAAADIEAGQAVQVARRWIRNLDTNEMERGEVYFGRQAECTNQFTPERWASFKTDLAWFREHRTPERWQASQGDHGYNAPPGWALVASPLTNALTANDRTILGLALIDPVLLALMFAAIWWAFGWRAVCVAAIWWGTNYPARVDWTGGGFLRTDWLMLSTWGICFMKKRMPAAAGAALTYASLLRIFPAFIVAALVLKVLTGMWSSRRLTLEPAHARFAVGAIATLLVVVPLSMVVVGGNLSAGAHAWGGFISNSRKHLDTPLSNNIGAIVVVAYDRSSTTEVLSEFNLDTPWDTWNVARRRLMTERRPVQWVLLAAFIALLARAVRHHPDWTALVLGIGLIPFATQLTTYYYAILLGYGMLVTRSPLAGAMLCLLSAFTIALPPMLRVTDDLYAAFSLLITIFVIAQTWLFSRTSDNDVVPPA